jgi:hypothetical protein
MRTTIRTRLARSLSLGTGPGLALALVVAWTAGCGGTDTMPGTMDAGRDAGTSDGSVGVDSSRDAAATPDGSAPVDAPLDVGSDSGCAADEMLCGSACVRVLDNAMHCGSCGNVCGGTTPLCAGSTCVAT